MTHHYPPMPQFGSPHNVVLVDLEEGVRFVSNLLDVDDDDIEIGMPVQVKFVAVDDDYVLPQFEVRALMPNVGDELPPLELPLTRTLIVAAAMATRDYQDVHHDPEAARAAGWTGHLHEHHDDQRIRRPLRHGLGGAGAPSSSG